jgi:hypothetical protein
MCHQSAVMCQKSSRKCHRSSRTCQKSPIPCQKSLTMCSLCCSMLQCVLQCVTRCVSTSYLTTSGVTFFFWKVVSVFVAVFMTHSCVYQESFLCAPWLTCMCVSWLISMCTMTHIYEYHKSWTISVVLEIWFFLVSVFSFMCTMSDSCVSFLREPWLSPTFAMTHSYVWRESFVCVPWPTFLCTTPHEPSVSF